MFRSSSTNPGRNALLLCFGAQAKKMAEKLVDIDGSALGPVDQALLGNSITLTPGTLTLDVHEGRLLVHALTPSGAAALRGGEMQRRVAALRKR